jgi:hypothetical protein
MPDFRPLGRARSLGTVLGLAILASFGAVMTMPRPVVACSCVGFTSWKDAVTPETPVFSGTAGQRDARGVPVRVDRWFSGKGPAPTVWLTAGSFSGNPGVSSSCEVEAPPPGSSWLWVAYPAENGDLGTSDCSPAGDLATAEGRLMFEEAAAAFGGVALTGTEPTDSPAEAATTPGPADVARDRTTVLILGGLLVGSLALFGVVALVARRRPNGEPDPR